MTPSQRSHVKGCSPFGRCRLERRGQFFSRVSPRRTGRVLPIGRCAWRHRHHRAADVDWRLANLSRGPVLPERLRLICTKVRWRSPIIVGSYGSMAFREGTCHSHCGRGVGHFVRKFCNCGSYSTYLSYLCEKRATNLACQCESCRYARDMRFSPLTVFPSSDASGIVAQYFPPSVESGARSFRWKRLVTDSSKSPVPLGSANSFSPESGSSLSSGSGAPFR